MHKFSSIACSTCVMLSGVYKDKEDKHYVLDYTQVRTLLSNTSTWNPLRLTLRADSGLSQTCCGAWDCFLSGWKRWGQPRACTVHYPPA